MKAIIDTHALIWAVDNPEQLGSQARAMINDSSNEILLSSGSIWELAIKMGLAKLTLSLPFRKWMNQAVQDLRLTVLPITIECADFQSALGYYHRDPFDRGGYPLHSPSPYRLVGSHQPPFEQGDHKVNPWHQLRRSLLLSL